MREILSLQINIDLDDHEINEWNDIFKQMTTKLSNKIKRGAREGKREVQLYLKSDMKSFATDIVPRVITVAMDKSSLMQQQTTVSVVSQPEVESDAVPDYPPIIQQVSPPQQPTSPAKEASITPPVAIDVQPEPEQEEVQITTFKPEEKSYTDSPMPESSVESPLANQISQPEVLDLEEGEIEDQVANLSITHQSQPLPDQQETKRLKKLRKRKMKKKDKLSCSDTGLNLNQLPDDPLNPDFDKLTPLQRIKFLTTASEAAKFCTGKNMQMSFNVGSKTIYRGQQIVEDIMKLIDLPHTDKYLESISNAI